MVGLEGERAPIISVVMPIHDTGVYLKDALQTIWEQSFKDYELICVDDHTTDEVTIGILDKYQKKMERMQVARLVDGSGAAKARNYGLKLAKGQYVVFLDSDDWFDTDFLDKMYTSIVEKDADICICANRVFDEKERTIVRDMCLKMPSDEVMQKGWFSLGELEEDGLNYWGKVPWNKLCKKSFLLEKNILFQNLTSQNDCYFSDCCSIEAEKIVYANGGKPLLTYRSGTISQISKNWKYDNYLAYFRAVWDRYGQTENTGVIKQITNNDIRWTVWLLELHGTSEEQRVFYNSFVDFAKKRFRKEGIDGKSNPAGLYYRYFLTKPYESKWYRMIGDYEKQLEEHREELLQIQWQSENTIIWGNGKRSQALQRFLAANGIQNILITDSDNSKLPVHSESSKCIRTEDVTSDMCIVATNRAVYSSLVNKEYLRVINLEEFCPL